MIAIRFIITIGLLWYVIYEIFPAAKKYIKMQNRLLHGDCLEEMDKLISEGIKVDAIICDPP